MFPWANFGRVLRRQQVSCDEARRAMRLEFLEMGQRAPSPRGGLMSAVNFPNGVLAKPLPANDFSHSSTQDGLWKIHYAEESRKSLTLWTIDCSRARYRNAISYLCPHQSNCHTLLHQLHWLPIKYRINFNAANITFNILHYSQPAYLHLLLCFHTPARSLRSSNTNLLAVLFTHTSLGARSFSVASHKISNSLPPALRSCNCPDTFRWHLKKICRKY